jgi:hypothetical protein
MNENKKMNKKLTFVLNVNHGDMANMYDFIPDYAPERTVMDKIQDSKYVFLDSYKSSHTWIYTFVDEMSKRTLGRNTNIQCWWCRQKHSNRPLGCPLKYVPNLIISEYHSELIKGIRIITSKLAYNEIPELTDDQRIEYFDFYVSEGIFCSFNCCLAYINKNINENPSKYQFSINLLLECVMREFGNVLITPSRDWRALKNNGGFMDIIEYFKGFEKVEYNYQKQTIRNTNSLKGDSIPNTRLFEPLSETIEEIRYF